MTRQSESFSRTRSPGYLGGWNDWVPPVRLGPASPHDTWGAERTEPRQSTGYLWSWKDWGPRTRPGLVLLCILCAHQGFFFVYMPWPRATVLVSAKTCKTLTCTCIHLFVLFREKSKWMSWILCLVLNMICLEYCIRKNWNNRRTRTRYHAFSLPPRLYF